MKKSTSTLTLILILILILFFSSCSNRELTNLTHSEKIDDHIVWKIIQTDDMNGSPASINILDIDLNKFDGEIVEG